MPGKSGREAQLDILLAKQALAELVAGYCHAVDRADEEALAALFHPDAMVHGGVVNALAPCFAREVVQWIRSNATVVFHTVTNETFVVDGDRATGECYVLAISTTPRAPSTVDTITAGRYLDRYERRDGVWKFSERTFVMDCNLNQPSSAVYDDAVHPPGRMRGGYKPDDPRYAFWGK